MSQGNVESGCLYLGEFVEQAEVAPEFSHVKASLSKVDVERPKSFIEISDSADEADMEFKILLRDDRVAVVRGHAVTFVPNPGPAGDAGSYGIVKRRGATESFVALFKVADVAGVFNGDLSASAPT